MSVSIASASDAFYTSIPITLPEEFRTYTFDHGDQMIFAWMIPITKPEAAYVRSKGWEKFERLLEAQNADLVDLDRLDYTRVAVNN